MMFSFQTHLTNNVQSTAKYDAIVAHQLYTLDYRAEQEFHL